MKKLNCNDFIKMLKKSKKGYKIIIEDRIGQGYNTYGIVNQGEFKNYMNPHDNLWDVIIPGYNYIFKPGKQFIVRDIIGYIYVPNGNYKIIVDIKKEKFSKKKFIADLNAYLHEYSYINNVQTKIILL